MTLSGICPLLPATEQCEDGVPFPGEGVLFPDPFLEFPVSLLEFSLLYCAVPGLDGEDVLPNEVDVVSTRHLFTHFGDDDVMGGIARGEEVAHFESEAVGGAAVGEVGRGDVDAVGLPITCAPYGFHSHPPGPCPRAARRQVRQAAEDGDRC